MLFYITFFYCFGVILAQNDTAIPTYIIDTVTCEQMSQTHLNPYVVIVLLKTSGRYVGMGSIVDPITVLTAVRVLKAAHERPVLLKVLAGRLCPWWGKDAQVKNVKEISVNVEGQLALLRLSRAFRLNRNVAPIRLYLKTADLKTKFDEQYVVFGVPRSNYDVQGEFVTKTTVYLRRLETLVTKVGDLDKCKVAFVESDYVDGVHFCIYANFSYNWGIIGSPVIALRSDYDVQIGVVTRAPKEEVEVYQRCTKFPKYAPWIKSLTFINYPGGA